MMPLDAPTVFGLLLVAGALLLSWRHTARRLALIRQEMAQLGQQVAAAARSIRMLGRESLKLRRMTTAQVQRERQLSQDCAELEAAKTAFHGSASPLVAMDERKAVGDRLWQVPVSRPAKGVQRPWRTFLVWAPGPERAQVKVANRYPPKAGYAVGPADERSGLPDSAQ